MDTAKPENVEVIVKNAKEMNPQAKLIKANSKIKVDKPQKIRGKKVLVIEDGPTLTHGGMNFGAGVIAAQRLGCKLIDPEPFAVGSIKETLKKYPELHNLVPAMGYDKKQIEELEKTINKTGCDAVVVGTPIDIGRLLYVDKPTVRVNYELDEIGEPNLKSVLDKFLRKKKLRG
jgi:predicted GTPase